MNDIAAFPIFETTESGHVYTAEFGMKLRDYFAARAMQGLVHDILIDQTEEDALMKAGLKPEEFPAYLAHLAYRTAEAMLAEREKPPEPCAPYAKPAEAIPDFGCSPEAIARAEAEAEARAINRLTGRDPHECVKCHALDCVCTKPIPREAIDAARVAAGG